MHKFSISLVFTLIVLNSLTYASDVEKKLRADLLKGYDTNVRPVKKFSSAVEVDTSLTLLDVNNFDPNSKRLSASFWYMVTWTDENLEWNPDKYEKIKSINMNVNDVWTPDFISYGFMEKYVIKEGKLVIFSNGMVMFVSTTKQNDIKCNGIDSKQFPYDSISCDFIMGSWTFDESLVNVTTKAKQISTDFFENNFSWTLVKSSTIRVAKKYEGYDEIYPQIRNSLVFKRNSASLCSTVVLPTILSVLFTLALLGGKAKGDIGLLIAVLLFVTDLGLLIYVSSMVGSLVSTPFISYALAINMVVALCVGVCCRHCNADELQNGCTYKGVKSS